MPLSRHRAKRLGREPRRRRIEEAREAAREFFRISLAEAIYELGADEISDEGFDELLLAAERKVSAVFKAAVRRAVYDAIRETDADSYSVSFGMGNDQPCDGGNNERSHVAQRPRDSGGGIDDSRLADIEERKKLFDLPFVTRDEAGILLQCSVDSIDRRLKDGTLKGKSIGRNPRVITQSILDALIDDPSVCDGFAPLSNEDLTLRKKLRKD